MEKHSQIDDCMKVRETKQLDHSLRYAGNKYFVCTLCREKVRSLFLSYGSQVPVWTVAGDFFNGKDLKKSQFK